MHVSYCLSSRALPAAVVVSAMRPMGDCRFWKWSKFWEILSMSCLCHLSLDALCIWGDIVYKWNYFEIKLTNYYKYLQTDCNYITKNLNIIIRVILRTFNSMHNINIMNKIHSIRWQLARTPSIRNQPDGCPSMTLIVSHSAVVAVPSPQRPLVAVLFGFHCVWLWGIIKAMGCDNIS